jgi:predicted ArsR family transcriptional regulator
VTDQQLQKSILGILKTHPRLKCSEISEKLTGQRQPEFARDHLAHMGANGLVKSELEWQGNQRVIVWSLTAEGIDEVGKP